MQINIDVRRLTVEAAHTSKCERVYHAAMLEPRAAVELDLDQVWHPVDDLIEAYGNWLSV